ncbi:MAG: hypothetical protein ACREQP_07120 [Candidatus Binatia bacterium]
MRVLNSGEPDKWQATGIQYQVALRCIGQDLTAVLLEHLEITVQDREFIAEGRLIGAGGEALARRYTPEKIKELDELGDLRKTGVDATPDASSLCESLRTVGRMVDSKRGRLVRLIKEQNIITFVYEDENGQAHREELYSLSIYKGQQEALTQRGSKKAADVWEKAATDRAPKNHPNLKLKS